MAGRCTEYVTKPFVPADLVETDRVARMTAIERREVRARELARLSL